MGEGARPIPPQGLVSKVFDFESSPPSPLTSNDDLRTHSETNSSSNPLTHSPSISIESDHEKSNFDETPVHFDEKAFETYLMSATSHLKNDFSSSTFQTEALSESSLSGFEPPSWLVGTFEDANDSLDKALKEVEDSSSPLLPTLMMMIAFNLLRLWGGIAINHLDLLRLTLLRKNVP